MEDEAREKYLRAGEVVQEAREIAREESEPGANLLEIVEPVESHIRDENLEPAFPVNVSLNEEAAHHTALRKEEKTLEASDVLKIDIGAHCDGFIADTALTVNPDGGHAKIIEAVEEVLEKALEFVEPGVTVGEFGSYVEKQVPEKYNVVQNLTGHYLGRYEQHAGTSIPNNHNHNTHEFEKGDAIAIEPFLSTGSGMVKNGADGNIYKLESSKVRDRTARKLVKRMEKYNGLPFASRWLELSGRERMAFKKMVQQEKVHSYPVLRDRSGSVVAQAEHTVLLGMAEDGGNIVTTRS